MLWASEEEANLGMYIRVLNNAGAVISQRWTADDFIGDTITDMAPAVGTNTYTIQVTGDGSGTADGAGPMSVLAEVVKR